MIREFEAKSILRKHKRIDSWFVGSYGINLYRGCTHNCVYCDGRNEKYQVEGSFGSDVSVKTNALELLGKELDPAGKRKPFRNGFMVVCGGVSDAYQPLEKKYGLCRGTLELLRDFGHPVHILTKSTLVERDLDVLKEISSRNMAMVSFSFSSVDECLSKLLEPGVPSPAAKLDLIKRFRDAGLHCGMYLMPVVPGITDSAEMIERTVSAAKQAGAEFVIFGGMTLKRGVQQEYFMDFLKKEFPDLVPLYANVYSGSDQWGSPQACYIETIHRRFRSAARKHCMPVRMPFSIYERLFTKTESIIVMLDQLDYLAKLHGKNSPYSYARCALEKLNEDVDNYSEDDLLRLSGIGKFTAGLIREVFETGKCGYYENMLF